jgi:hypothetical protein
MYLRAIRKNKAHRRIGLHVLRAFVQASSLRRTRCAVRAQRDARSAASHARGKAFAAAAHGARSKALRTPRRGLQASAKSLLHG